MFISILYMFRATSCLSSEESIVSIQRLVYVTLCRWLSGMQVPDLYTRRSPTQGDIYRMLYWYNWLSWWWARGCSKHVENWHKHIGKKKRCASSWSFTRIIYSKSFILVSKRLLQAAGSFEWCPSLTLCKTCVRLYNGGQTERTPLLTEVFVRDFYLPPTCIWGLRSSAMLRGAYW
jgi:hypothetical protein